MKSVSLHRLLTLAIVIASVGLISGQSQPEGQPAPSNAPNAHTRGSIPIAASPSAFAQTTRRACGSRRWARTTW